MRGVVAHHHHRRVVLPLDQQPGLFPDRQRDRPQHPFHSLARQPAFRRGQQRAGDGLVLGIEIAEKAGAGAEALFGRHGEREFVDMRRDAPDRPPARSRDEQLHAGMAEEGVLVRIDQLDLLGTDLGHEMRQTVGKRPTKIDEGRPAPLVADRLDLYLRGAGRYIRHEGVLVFALGQGVCVALASIAQAIDHIDQQPAFGLAPDLR